MNYKVGDSLSAADAIEVHERTSRRSQRQPHEALLDGGNNEGFEAALGGPRANSGEEDSFP